MPERRYRMVKQHPGPGPAHDNLDTFLHLPPIAMQRTVLTGRLVGPEPASIEPQTGILQHLAACRTQLRMPLLFRQYNRIICSTILFSRSIRLFIPRCFSFPTLRPHPSDAASPPAGAEGFPEPRPAVSPESRCKGTCLQAKNHQPLPICATIPPLWRSKYRDGAGCTPRAVREEPPHRRMPFRPDPGVNDRREAAA